MTRPVATKINLSILVTDSSGTKNPGSGFRNEVFRMAEGKLIFFVYIKINAKISITNRIKTLGLPYQPRTVSNNTN